MLDKDVPFADRASIPSRVISDHFLNVFVVYGSNVEDDVFFFNKDLKPEEDKRGVFSVFSDGTTGWTKRTKGLKKYIRTLEEMYLMRIDSLDFKPSFVYALNPKKQMGYKTFIDMENISRGKHILRVRRKDHIRDSVYYINSISIPFWYFPEE